ncbi:MAG: phage tail spike protein [Enterococcus canintestini]
MKIYVMTKADETVAVLDNTLSGGIHYFDDEFHRYLESSASTFDLSIAKKHMMYSNASTGAEDDFQYLKENHFLVFRYKNKDYKFTIRRIEETESSLRLFCEDLSFDLLNEYRGPYKADKAYPISKYVNDCLVDSGYEIGINEFAKNERTLEWEGDQTVLKRLLSICNSFGAEIEFETILNDDRTVSKQLVHLRKRVGMDRPDIELKYGRDVSSIRRNVDVTELITAIKPRGHEEDGKVTTIKNVEKEIKDEDGNIVFYTKKGSEYIYAPMANQEYGNPKRKGGGYIVGQFSYDTKSDTELFNRALTELEKKCVPAYEFEIEGFYDVDVGDTIRAIDEGYNPILLLEARISEQTISFSDPTKNKTVYSNYRILENKVSQSLLDRIDEVKKYAEQVAKTYIFSISNVGSPMFRNGEGEVTFTAKIEKNNQDITGEFTEFNWIKQKKDGSLDSAWNEAHKNFGKTLTIKPADFEETATFSYEVLQEGLIIGGASGVVTKVYDGEDGKTPVKGVDYFDGKPGTNGLSAYLHIRYSQNANGNPMTTDPTGAKYVGIQASQNPNPSTVPADYNWTLVKGDAGIPGETGADGKTSYLHIKYSNDGGKTFTGNGGEDEGAWMGQYVDFTQADSTDVKKYAWSKIKGEDGKDGKDGIAGKDGVGLKSTVIQYAQSTSGTVAPESGWTAQVPALVKGQYLWTKTVWTYTDNTNETGYTVSRNAKDGNDGKDGSNGVSVSSVVEEYYVSTSPTSQSGGSWSTTVPNNSDPNKYIWRRLKTTMSNGTVTYTNPALIQGMTGIYPHIGPTQPANPKEGQQWWKSDASGNITNFYEYKSGSWQARTIQQSVLNIIELNAVRILGSTITGTTINTSVLNNSGTYQDSGATILYNSTFNGNIMSDWAVQNSTQNGTFILSPRNLAAISYADSARKTPDWHWIIDNNGIDVGNPAYSAIYGGEGITIYNAQLSPKYGRVKLEFQDLMELPIVQIPAVSGWAPYSTSGGNRPTATRKGRLVQLAGAFKNNAAVNNGATSVEMGVLPVGYRPENSLVMIAQGSMMNRYLLEIWPSGSIRMSRYGTTAYTQAGAGSWFNIACTFSAADV